ncbi:hypothetical protein FPZ24_07215 [Sphingomonas panacisoli]|uniref:Lipoprotein n=1 Tax=Sphingomonas panacisoli TaxID=1813879 RepID=A0A5B8LI29_9SPHN|nr:hypothetical protein [Sphingomonas panacisoli]QDZ07292.1 hypothetical protein FPZ24_07215 [Sphingomonas panacisoli]
MKRSAVLPLILLAAGCAQSTDKYPSLALRPIESRSEAETVAPVPEATPDAALDAQLATMRSKLAQIDADFVATAAKADAAAKARGAQATGSDQWLAAQSLLAELEGLRGDTLGMVTDFEKLITDRGEANQPPYPALDELRAKAQAQVDGEIEKIAAIKAQLGEK